MKHLKNLYLIVGESGSGKSTIVKQLCNKHDLSEVKSYTTRAPRYESEDTHTFITMEEAQKLTNIIAETTFSGNYYCATQEQVDDADLYVIDKVGIEFFKQNYKGDRKFKIIYITAPFFVRQRRMLARGDNNYEAVARLINDDKAFYGVRELADIEIRNIELEESLQSVWGYIVKQECDRQCLQCKDGLDDDGALYCKRNLL